MKSLVRAVLSSLLVVPVVACGGDEAPPAPVVSMPVGSGGVPDMMMPLPEVTKPSEPVREVPVKIENVDAAIAIPTRFAEALELGKQLAAKGDPKAKEVLETAAKLDKKSALPYVELARMYIARNERANALKAANKAVKLAPESSQAYNTLGRAELLRFNYDNAIVAFRQATELDADNVWAWNNLGFAYLQLEKYQEAVDALAEATSRKGTTGYMWNNLGTAYEHLDQLDEARDAFENGGKLGSLEAKASRKRLEGVDTIVVMKEAPAPVETTYETREEMPAVEAVVEDAPADAEAHEQAHEPDVDAPKVEEPKVEALELDEPKGETPAGDPI
ncbi:MAG: tetratricopeptide repeat protein [Kofleriaceae bacterium]|nr:tetratricopeptide repeat protein [Kofleriaceae bacterium]